MDMKNSKLFSPLTVGSLTLRNRVGMAPMSMDYEAKDGTVPKRLADIFVRRAEGGTGYVMIDAVTVDRKYQYIGKTTCLDSDDLVPQFRDFAKRVSDTGSTLVPQIIHPGPESICGFRGIPPLGPSVNTNANCHVSRAMTIDEIHEVIKQFGQAARRVEEAGCGAIGLHCAHAYMMPGAFLSPLRNKRMDEYGGCIDNRARFILEVIAEVRANVSPDFPIFLRVSGSERVEGGNSLDEMLYLAPKFEAAGVNLIEVSGGTQYEGLENIIPSHGKQEMTKWLVHLNYRAKKAGVKFEFGKEATVEAVKEFNPDAVIVATGAKPLIPPIKGTQDYPVRTAHDFLKGKFVIPKGRVCILGGGEVACETAETILANARPTAFTRGFDASIGDVEVTIIEMLPQILTGVCMPNRAPLMRTLKANGVDINVNTKVLEVTDHDVKVQRKDGTEEWLRGFDYIIFGLGARNYDPLSEKLKEFVPEVHVIGDAVKARQSSDAMWEGFEVAYNL